MQIAFAFLIRIALHVHLKEKDIRFEMLKQHDADLYSLN